MLIFIVVYRHTYLGTSDISDISYHIREIKRLPYMKK